MFTLPYLTIVAHIYKLQNSVAYFERSQVFIIGLYMCMHVMTQYKTNRKR